MEQDKLKCIWGVTFLSNDFNKHYGGCAQFKSEFKDFFSKINEVLKPYLASKEKLLIIRHLLKLYIVDIENKIKKFYNSFNNDNSKNQNQKQIPQQIGNYSNPINQQGNIRPQKIIENPWKKKNENEINKNPNNIDQIDFENDFEPQPIQNNDIDIELCPICKINPNIIYLDCIHPICYDCFEKKAKKKLSEMKCDVCNKLIPVRTKKEILQDKYYIYEKEELDRVFKGKLLIKCPYPECGEQNIFEPGNVDYNVKDENGKILTRQAAEDYAKNRCRCGFCRKDFCKECGRMPYHLGKTCKEQNEHEKAKKCRFCDTEIKGFNMGPDDDVCNSSECRERYKVSCKKRLKCGHKCFGVNGEKICPPCIDEECPQYGGQFDQNKSAYCPICYTEGLGSSPVIVTSCGHYMHYLCIKKRLETKWIGPKITFNHCLCPGCNKWFDVETKIIWINKRNVIKKIKIRRFR